MKLLLGTLHLLLCLTVKSAHPTRDTEGVVFYGLYKLGVRRYWLKDGPSSRHRLNKAVGIKSDTYSSNGCGYVHVP